MLVLCMFIDIGLIITTHLDDIEVKVMDLEVFVLKFLFIFICLYLLNMLMDQVDTLHNGRHWSEVLCCAIMTHLSDLEFKVKEFEILC